MSQTQTVSTGNEQAEAVQSFLEKVDRQDSACKIWPVVVGLLARRPQSQKITEEYLSKWAAECLTPKGIGEIVGCGSEDGLSVLISLTQGDCCPVNRQDGILDFFQNLSIREKFLIHAFDELRMTVDNVSSGREELVEALDKAVSFDKSEIPSDLQFLLGALELSNYCK